MVNVERRWLKMAMCLLVKLSLTTERESPRYIYHQTFDTSHFLSGSSVASDGLTARAKLVSRPPDAVSLSQRYRRKRASALRIYHSLCVKLNHCPIRVP